MKILALVCLAATVLEVAPVPCGNGHYRPSGQSQPAVTVVMVPQTQPASVSAAVPATPAIGGFDQQSRRRRDVSPPPHHKAEAPNKLGGEVNLGVGIDSKLASGSSKKNSAQGVAAGVGIKEKINLGEHLSIGKEAGVKGGVGKGASIDGSRLKSGDQSHDASAAKQLGTKLGAAVGGKVKIPLQLGKDESTIGKEARLEAGKGESLGVSGKKSAGINGAAKAAGLLGAGASAGIEEKVAMNSGKHESIGKESHLEAGKGARLGVSEKSGVSAAKGITSSLGAAASAGIKSKIGKEARLGGSAGKGMGLDASDSKSAHVDQGLSAANAIGTKVASKSEGKESSHKGMEHDQEHGAQMAKSGGQTTGKSLASGLRGQAMKELKANVGTKADLHGAADHAYSGTATEHGAQQAAGKVVNGKEASGTSATELRGQGHKAQEYGLKGPGQVVGLGKNVVAKKAEMATSAVEYGKGAVQSIPVPVVKANAGIKAGVKAGSKLANQE